MRSLDIAFEVNIHDSFALHSRGYRASQAYSQPSSPISAETTGKVSPLVSIVWRRSAVLYPAHSSRSRERGALSLGLVGVSPPRPHEPLHARSIPGGISFRWFSLSFRVALAHVQVQRYRPHEASRFVEDGTLIANIWTIITQERSQPTPPTVVVS